MTVIVPDYIKSVSWCRLRRALKWFGETLWGWEIGMGREWGGGGQFTSNLGPGWTRISPRKEEGFQVSRRDSGERGVVKGSQQGELARGTNKGLRHGLVSLIWLQPNTSMALLTMGYISMRNIYMRYTSMRYSSMRHTSTKSRCSIEHYYILNAIQIYGSILLLVLEVCPKIYKFAVILQYIV